MCSKSGGSSHHTRSCITLLDGCEDVQATAESFDTIRHGLLKVFSQSCFTVFELEAIGEEKVLHFVEVFVFLHLKLVLEGHLDCPSRHKFVTLALLRPSLLPQRRLSCVRLHWHRESCLERGNRRLISSARPYGRFYIIQFTVHVRSEFLVDSCVAQFYSRCNRHNGVARAIPSEEHVGIILFTGPLASADLR